MAHRHAKETLGDHVGSIVWADGPAIHDLDQLAVLHPLDVPLVPPEKTGAPQEPEHLLDLLGRETVCVEDGVQQP